VWRGLNDSRDWPASTDAWFAAQGHYGGTSEALVRVSPNAYEQYQQHTLGSELKPGSTLIMLHRSQATGKHGPVHAMRKQQDGWDFLLLESNGAVVAQGQLASCARCHAEAASDFVFGPPRRTGEERLNAAATE
jgi:hypothetical protein